MGSDDELERGVIFGWPYYVHVACFALAFLSGLVSYVLPETAHDTGQILFGGLLVLSGIFAIVGRKAISLQTFYLDMSRKSFAFQTGYAVVLGAFLLLVGVMSVLSVL